MTTPACPHRPGVFADDNTTMTCNVKNCTNDPVALKDLDPDKVGGWSSYSYEVALCQQHLDQINGGVDWVCHDVEGVSGWEVLINEQIKDLGKYVVQSVPNGTSSGPMSSRSSGVLPSGFMLPIEAHLVGSREATNPLELYLDADQARQLIENLELHISVLER
jgi:hypothetical protein